ncbi:hypothetical protein [Vagococcus jeotgali]|uniref:hypothetical protein n=1 Tax=Vagococcus jeotgali TaxID=3109030 RepID=UPI002DDC0634|nr:hypothetical protein [Vagococcus sp. B2T-5]
MEKISDSKKTEFTYQAIGTANPRKQSLTNLRPDTEDKDILALSDIFQTLAPSEEPMEKLAIINTHHYSI